MTPISRAGWMRQGRFGLMVRPSLPVGGLDATIDAFDLDGFMADVRRAGAAWLIFPIGQNIGFYTSPNAVLDRLAGPGHASRRDLVMEVAERARRACRKFIAYLPVEVRGQPEALRRAFGWDDAKDSDQAEFQRRYAAFIREYATRFGDLLDGWWFDGAYSSPTFADSTQQADLLLEAARAGNPAAAVAFNDGSFSAGSDRAAVAGQDYLAGTTEALVGGKVRFGRDSHAPLLDPIAHDPQPPPGCLWHALIPIDGDRIHGKPPAPGLPVTFTDPARDPNEMGPPRYDTTDLETVVRDFKGAGGGVTFSAGISPEGRLGEGTAAQLAELARRLSARRG